MSEYTINYSVDGWPICKNGEPIPNSNKAKLAELHQLQARIEELAAEKAKLVEVLEQVIKAAPIVEARAALAAHRKKGTE